MKKTAMERSINKTYVPLDSSGNPDPEQCWIWIGGTTSGGYGMIRGEEDEPDGSPRRMKLVTHVVAVHHGITSSMKEEVNHLCGNPGCVNPSHLVKGCPKTRNKLAIERRGGRPWVVGPHSYKTCEHCGITSYYPQFNKTHKNCGPV